MIIVTFYTPAYEGIFYKHLYRSVCDLHSKEVKLYSKRVDKQLSWEKSTCLKPRVILSYLETFKKDLWWTDSDSEVKECMNVNLPETACVGFHNLSHRKYYKKRKELLEPLTGTLFFKYSKDSIAFLAYWIRMTEICDVDGEAFALTIEKYPDMAHEIPFRYCFIPRKGFEAEEKKAACVHFQASRNRKVN